MLYLILIITRDKGKMEVIIKGMIKVAKINNLIETIRIKIIMKEKITLGFSDSFNKISITCCFIYYFL